MKTSELHLLNLVLMAAALFVAVVLPFDLFLLAYAVLGPLHYLTEINWLNHQQFHLEKKTLIWIPIVVTLTVSIPIFLTFIASAEVIQIFNPLLRPLRQAYPYAIILCLVLAAGIVRKGNMAMIWTLILAAGSFFWWLRDNNPYHMLGTVLLPTVIHVYVFTLAFIIYGLIKKPDRLGTLEAAALVLAPVIITVLPKTWLGPKPTADTLSTFLETGFSGIVAQLGRLLQQPDWQNVKHFVQSESGIRIQIFMAFAYTYHYLNWFSKVSLIGWLRKANPKQVLIIIALWLTAVGLYAYDYRLGLSVLFTLSLLHVTLEFPLNIISIRGVLNKLLDLALRRIGYKSN